MPAQFCMPAAPVSAADAALDELAARTASLQAAPAAAILLGCFAALIRDPRDRRGDQAFPGPSILAMCTAAVLCGCSSLEDVTAWVGAGPITRSWPRSDAAATPSGSSRTAAPGYDRAGLHRAGRLAASRSRQHVLARRGEPGSGRFPVAAPAWLPAIAVDGKAVRGAVGADGLVPYLLAAATHGNSAVIAERLIGPKTNEVPEFAPLLRELNGHAPLAGHVITINAGGTQSAPMPPSSATSSRLTTS